MFGTTARLTAVLLGSAAAVTINGTGTRETEPGDLRPLTYHARVTGLESGTYHWTGVINGAITGRGDVDAIFDAGTVPGGVPLRTHWRVTVKPDSRSFEASLSGVMDPKTGRTHLVGAIIRGEGRGQMVETESQWTNREPNGTLSTNGVMTIWPPSTFAQDTSSPTAPLPPGTFTTSARSDEWKIANALSAGPANITVHATVLDWPANPNEGLSDARVLRQGTNGWTCLPDVPGRPQHDPMCNDETMMKWLAATLAGKKPDIDRVGLSYMLMGEARQGQGVTPAKDPSQVKDWYYIGPHIMVVLPDASTNALRGINQDISHNLPYTTLLNSTDVATPLWIIPVAKYGERL